MNIAEPRICLETMADQFRKEIFAYIRSRVGDAATADDLTQETFLKVERALTRGTEPEHFRGWIFQIARNSVLDWMKERRRLVALAEERGVGEPVDRQAVDSVDNEFRQGLFAYASNVIERMPSEDREALTLTELDGLSREELAKHLGISVSAAKSRVVRARAKLRKTIEECCRLITDPYGRVIGWRRRATACCGTTLEKV
ncbi:MAG TPA: sigma-70 family RNA polymerase sigma factor [Chthoniobacterales bacterium]|jgi:RNA polymerase sigma-70 factor, ECF subfamily|nr:sigma-70 family RNA polymerase sigma factor [Chthoniobacterales bacterium]